MSAYYNEIDPFAAAWLRELIKAGNLPAGEVDERSIKDVDAGDLRQFTQCHFFAGIGGWALALRLAGWPDERPVWTGSCPCQPYSCAGQGKGDADERNLWPEFLRLIEVAKPASIFGEQVEAAIKYGWLDGVSTDLEAQGYAVGSVVLPACCTAKSLRPSDEGDEGIGKYGEQIAALLSAELAAEFRKWWRESGYYALYDCDHNSAPHKRDRLWWCAHRAVADASKAKRDGRSCENCRPGQSFYIADSGKFMDRFGDSPGTAIDRAVGIANGTGRDAGIVAAEGSRYGSAVGSNGAVGGVSDADGSGHNQRTRSGEQSLCDEDAGNAGWRDYRIVPCRDGNTRRIESGIEPLAHGIRNRVGQLRGYGNAIVPQVAAEFIKAGFEWECEG